MFILIPSKLARPLALPLLAITLGLASVGGCADASDNPFTTASGGASGDDASEDGDSGEGDDTHTDGDSGDDDSGDGGDGDGDSGDGDSGDGDSGDGDSGDDGMDPEPLEPIPGGSSGGSGGGPAQGDPHVAPGGVKYWLIAPAGPGPHPLLMVYPNPYGTGEATKNAILGMRDQTGTADFVFAILDNNSQTHIWDAEESEIVLGEVRGLYDIDNDRTSLLSESGLASSGNGMRLALQIRQSYFAAVWIMQPIKLVEPLLNVEHLGFAPHFNASNSASPFAPTLVQMMNAAGYRVAMPAPWQGDTSTAFQAALAWFPGKTRQ